MDNIIMLILLSIAILIYFKNNPAGHDKKFIWRRFLNWFPLGLSYAFLYMARYNLTVSKTALGNLMTKEDFGLIFGVGALVYGFSFLINGPLVDRIGGKKGMIIGMTGATVANIAMGFVIYKILYSGLRLNLTQLFCILYGVNMYFQSYGAVSIVKVNAPWFHVRERGIFSGIFGTLISLGIYFAFDWGGAIVKAVSVNLKPGTYLDPIQNFLRGLTGAAAGPVNQIWYVFYIPALLLAAFIIINLLLIKDTPSEAGLKDFDTLDASSGEMDQKFSTLQIFKKILTNPIILTICAIEFCSGVIRNGIMHWYFIFAAENKAVIGTAALWFKDHWGMLLCLAGISGGFIAGIVSDKLFHSRRGPSAAFMYFSMFAAVLYMAFALYKNQYILGGLMVFISLCVIGVHGLLSGTATMDFGGRKGAATAVGVIDGFVYLGTGFQSIALGKLTTMNWNYWPWFLLPFTLIGFFLAIKIWHAIPDAMRKKKPADITSQLEEIKKQNINNLEKIPGRT
ncbi:MAG: MFS transporter [Armatimonadota bacterium]